MGTVAQAKAELRRLRRPGFRVLARRRGTRTRGAVNFIEVRDLRRPRSNELLEQEVATANHAGEGRTSAAVSWTVSPPSIRNDQMPGNTNGTPRHIGTLRGGGGTRRGPGLAARWYTLNQNNLAVTAPQSQVILTSTNATPNTGGVGDV